jgi:DNA-binding response OmpR family regulator
MEQLQTALPDVILLDWELPGRPSLTLLHQIHDLPSQPKIIVMSSRPEAEKPSLRVGADLFISKGHPPDHLLAVLRELKSKSDLDGPSIGDVETKDG